MAFTAPAAPPPAALCYASPSSIFRAARASRLCAAAACCCCCAARRRATSGSSSQRVTGAGSTTAHDRSITPAVRVSPSCWLVAAPPLLMRSCAHYDALLAEQATAGYLPALLLRPPPRRAPTATALCLPPFIDYFFLSASLGLPDHLLREAPQLPPELRAVRQPVDPPLLLSCVVIKLARRHVRGKRADERRRRSLRHRIQRRAECRAHNR